MQEHQLTRTRAATPVLVDAGRAFARYPFLRDPGRAIPDLCYDVTSQLAVRPASPPRPTHSSGDAEPCPTDLVKALTRRIGP
ncbi:hypothetical protein [Streptomyces sp. NPDC006739]|uniref:hypothetical protein n=1 Tax=Streptomyces sp. NPDC006739 TaxID=3364763 RepID=UPI003675314C